MRPTPDLLPCPHPEPPVHCEGSLSPVHAGSQCRQLFSLFLLIDLCFSDGLCHCLVYLGTKESEERIILLSAGFPILKFPRLEYIGIGYVCVLSIWTQNDAFVP